MDWYTLAADFVNKFGATIVGLLAVWAAWATARGQLRHQADQEYQQYKRRLYADLISSGYRRQLGPETDEKARDEFFTAAMETVMHLAEPSRSLLTGSISDLANPHRNQRLASERLVELLGALIADLHGRPLDKKQVLEALSVEHAAS